MKDSRGENLKIVPLGGCGEIGMNCTALEAGGKVLLVDCGVVFPAPDQLGVQLGHPSFEYPVSRRDDMVGLVLTHGHEDHIAAIPYLLRELDVPVWGSPYTMGLVRSRMREFDHAGRLKAGILAPGAPTRLGPFSVGCFPVPHSIPDNLGLIIEAAGRRILHTGDFKLGAAGEGGTAPMLERIAPIAKEGIDLLLCDSTGAEEREPSGDERAVRDELARLVAGAEGRVYVAVFASNVSRLASIAEVAKRSGRKLAFSGRSVLNHVSVAGEVGTLRLPDGLVIPTERVMEHPRDGVIVALSGTQGEERSAMGRLSTENHRLLDVAPGDTVVLSSRFIPGNELAISRTIDRLLRLGARVEYRDNNPNVHVSGHGSRDEIRRLVEAVRPVAFMPVHGTYRHLVSCERIAREQGVARTAVASNGVVAVLDDDGIRLNGDTVPARKILIDGGTGVSEAAMRDRRLLGTKGLLLVSWIPDDDHMPAGRMEVVLKGVVSEEAIPWTADQVRDVANDKLRSMSTAEREDTIECAEAVRLALRKFMSKTMSREPFVHACIHAGLSS